MSAATVLSTQALRLATIDDDTDACLNSCEAARCGDGIRRVGVESCDDGNTDNTDACLNSCQVAGCGDGFVQADVESCDDGNTVLEVCTYGLTSCEVCDAECATVAGVTGTVAIPSLMERYLRRWQRCRHRPAVISASTRDVATG